MKVYAIYATYCNNTTYVAADSAKEAVKTFLESDVLFKEEWYDKPYKAHCIKRLEYETDKPCIIEEL